MRIFTILLLLLSAISNGMSEDNRYDEPMGGFSYVPPAQWRLMEIPGMTYRMALDKPAQGFTASITVVERDYPKNFERFIRETRASFPRFYENCKIISQQPFKTDSGINGQRIVVSGTIKSQELRQITYLLDTPGSLKFVMTGTSLLSDGDRRDHIFDAAAQSFIRTVATTTSP